MSNNLLFLMMEVPTIRLLHMHRIPASFRTYEVAIFYGMQDKIQNDMMPAGPF
ncbi:hypothetical protein [Leeuwenhoekiella marinoflava]|uniref:hypothetical protein n=1 Tax=Leeuwenhoekiella marinoflava TaxID=988 RepID=UPI003742970B